MFTQNNASDSALVSNHQRGSPSMNTHDDDGCAASATAARTTKASLPSPERSAERKI
jgi:hypothetical protein